MTEAIIKKANYSLSSTKFKKSEELEQMKRIRSGGIDSIYFVDILLLSFDFFRCKFIHILNG